jgi:hypothetical protein
MGYCCVGSRYVPRMARLGSLEGPRRDDVAEARAEAAATLIVRGSQADTATRAGPRRWLLWKMWWDKGGKWMRVTEKGGTMQGRRRSSADDEHALSIYAKRRK